MSLTPFDSLLHRERQRKMQLINKIEKKDLRRRSVSYNLKIQNESQEAEQDKQKERTRINFTNSAKKSYYCRKFLNKTV